MADKDKFYKIEDTIDADQSPSKVDDSKQAVRPSRYKKKDLDRKCCRCFSIRAGFLMYGVLDILIFLTFFGCIIHYLVLKQKVPLTIYLLLLIQAPNAFGFICVLGADKGVARKMYTYALAFKLSIISIVFPFLFLYI
jgi:hypothetical protein